MIRAIVTLCGIGYIPASGTVASAAALPLAWLLHWAGGFWLLLAATLMATLAGWWATARYIAEPGRSADPGEVVIDELVGQWIALFPLSLGLTMAGSAAHVFPWPGWAGGFIAFRLFDIWKPGPIGWADRMHGATGVMLDDVIAGAMAAAVMTVAAGAAHGWFA